MTTTRGDASPPRVSIDDLIERYHALLLDAPLFAEAERRAGTCDLVMIGDQLATDILGARGYGLDSALVETGLAPPTPGGPEMAPTFVLSGLGDRDQR